MMAARPRIAEGGLVVPKWMVRATVVSMTPRKVEPRRRQAGRG